MNLLYMCGLISLATWNFAGNNEKHRTYSMQRFAAASHINAKSTGSGHINLTNWGLKGASFALCTLMKSFLFVSHAPHSVPVVTIPPAPSSSRVKSVAAVASRGWGIFVISCPDKAWAIKGRKATKIHYFIIATLVAVRGCLRNCLFVCSVINYISLRLWFYVQYCTLIEIFISWS